MSAQEATTILTPPEYLRPCLKRMGEAAGSFPSTHRLAACAMLHYQFAAIHPFFDGNGRIVRLLTALLFRHYGLIDGPYLFISEVLKARSSEYAARLHSLDWYGEVVAWVHFFVDAIREQASHNADLVKLAAQVRKDMCAAPRAEKLLKTLMGWYGFSQIVDSADPIFQFGDLYDLFAV
jgi:Fic family protein